MTDMIQRGRLSSRVDTNLSHLQKTHSDTKMAFRWWILWLLFASTSAAVFGACRGDSEATGRPTRHPWLKSQNEKSSFLTNKTRKFRVNGTGVPGVDFDVGESYAGLLPVSEQDNADQLYFWFYPSANPTANKEIVIWLSGGPGCSSTGELLRGNGPISWLPGTSRPLANAWSWHRLTNVVWIDQPVGAGFSKGQATARHETDVATQFMGFWRNFANTFALHGYKIYITGSSYSGMYGPFIASAMLDARDKNYFDLTGLQIFDGLFSTPQLASNIPIADFTETWSSLLALNDSVEHFVRSQAENCGYSEYLRRYLVFPPTEHQPATLPGIQPDGALAPGCDIGHPVVAAAQASNPCFSIYDITKHCPLPFDPLGFNDDIPYAPDRGADPVYLNRGDVKAAINAPVDVDWAFCSRTSVFVGGVDGSLAGVGSRDVLATVIDRTRNVIIGHGMRDLALPANGSLLVIQNMTWGGKLGFQARPSGALYVPYHHHDSTDDHANLAEAGVVGTSHSERGLTYMAVAGAGHFLGMDAPAVAYRSLEVLLGRVENLKSKVPFTTDRAATPQPPGAIGRGTVEVGARAQRPSPPGLVSPEV
ncbi:uncharacterized protein E0L32_002737 [Thyridium curvatum]|uniref:Serine carboxypeptidase n=1 Tax=Thyridium curvatum TaxID=1093900 RepID=A0A507BN62_9PEZI|nr:uncharacterized protein E0L32_002737 [Thyridium curvatum]TPX18228.1 hypothetical protein E0L32_002737 [Thyridium curvatum]